MHVCLAMIAVNLSSDSHPIFAARSFVPVQRVCMQEAAVSCGRGSLQQPAPGKDKKQKKSGAKHTGSGSAKKVKKRTRDSGAAEELQQPAPDNTAVLQKDAAPDAPTHSAKDNKEIKKKRRRLLEDQENGDSAMMPPEVAAAEQTRSEPPKKKKKKKKSAADYQENGVSHVQLCPVPTDAAAGMQDPGSAPAVLEGKAVPTDSVARKEKKKKKNKKSKVGDEAVCGAEAVTPAPEAAEPGAVDEEVAVDAAEGATEEAGEWDEHEEAAGEGA